MENVASIITPVGYEVPLSLDEDGRMIIPPPAEIEEIKADGEGKWVEPSELSAHPPPPLTEEEWKMQEAQRMLEEAARRLFVLNLCS